MSSKSSRSASSLGNAKRFNVSEGTFCNYSHHICSQNALEGYDYCLRHILEDKSSSYKQCSYVSAKTGIRCIGAAPKSDKKEGYCQHHCKLAAHYRYKVNKKQQKKDGAASVIAKLSHYVADSDKAPETTTTPTNNDLDYNSSDESDNEALTLAGGWKGDVESEAESVDSEQEDLLKHAGVYTAEEVALVMRDKLIRLQSLYIEQFKHLQHLLRERRRDYLQAAKSEKDSVGLGYYKGNPKTRNNYFQLRALRKYHQRHGHEAALHNQSKQRRVAVSQGFVSSPASIHRCIYITEGNRCSDLSLPLSKYCFKHILSDMNQVLFLTCSFTKCRRPVIDMGSEVFCKYHAQLPPPSLLPESQPPMIMENVPRDKETESEKILDPLELQNVTWNVSDTNVRPLPLLPENITDLNHSFDTSAEEEPVPPT